MSLPKAHELQQTVLARVGNLALAAALVMAAGELLGFRYTPEGVCCETPEVRAEWDSLVTDMGIPSGPAVKDLARAPDHVIANALRGPTAQAVVGILDFVLGDELTEFLIQMDMTPNASLATHLAADSVPALQLP